MSNDIEEPVSATAWRIFKGDWKMYTFGVLFGLLLLANSAFLAYKADKPAECAVQDSINSAPPGPLLVAHTKNGAFNFGGQLERIYLHVLDSRGVSHFWEVNTTGKYSPFVHVQEGDDLRSGQSALQRTAHWIDSTAQALSSANP